MSQLAPTTRPGGRDADPSYRPLVTVAVCFLAGIFAQRNWPAPTVWWLAGLGATLGGWCWWRRHGSPCRSILLSAAVVAAGGARLASWSEFSANDLGRWAPRDGVAAYLEGRVHALPGLEIDRDRSGRQAWPHHSREASWVLHASRLRDGSRWIDVTGRLLVHSSEPPGGCRLGDVVRLGGRLYRPPRPGNPGQRDRRRLLLGRRVTAELAQRGQVELIRRRPWSAASTVRDMLGQWIGQLRQGALRTLRDRLPDRQADLAAALVLGERSALAEELEDSFRRTGVMHVLAVSGMHVSMVLLGVWCVLHICGAAPGSSLAVIATTALAYAVLAGGAPPVWRAAVLAVLAAAARVLGRRVCWWNALAGAALMLLLARPTHAFETGVQLSFLAVAALLQSPLGSAHAVSPDPLRRLIEKTRPWPIRWGRRAARTALTAIACSLWVWSATAPLVMLRFHLLSPWAVVLSPILWAPVAAALLSAMLLLIAPGLWPIAWIAASICQLSLSIVLWLIEGAESWGGAWLLAGPPRWWTILWHVQLGAACFAPLGNNRPRRRWLALWAGIGVVLMAYLPRHCSQLQCTALSVGHGSAVVIEAPGGGVMVYDAGCLGGPRRALEGLSDYLWSRRIARINPLVISHADADHLNAAAELMDRFRVARLIVPRSLVENTSASVQQMLRAARRRGVRIQLAHRGMSWTLGQARVGVLHPPRGTTMPGGDNAQSLVLLVSWSSRTLLLPGDVEGPGLNALLEQRGIAVDLLLAAHHGSARSNPFAFVRWCQPGGVIISGARACSRSVLREFSSQGASVWQTELDGAVQGRLGRQAVRIRGWRSRPWQ